MSDSYAGISFDVIMPDEWRPHWTQEGNIAVTHIPYANKDDVQFGGRGNDKIVVEALLDSASGDVDIETLRGTVGDGTARTLTLFAAAYANTYLLAAKGIQRVEGVERWRVELEFMRTGS